MLYCGNAVCDQDCCFPFTIVPEIMQDMLFRIGVDSGKGVIKDQDRRIFHQGAGDGAALFLTAGKRNATFADDRIIVVRKICNIIVNAG